MRNRSTRTTRRPSHGGFTLVELLIVIIIIAVLAAVAIPKFANSSTRSKEGTLKSNLKIVRNSVEMFRADTGLSPLDIQDMTTEPGGTTAGAPPTQGLSKTGATVTIPSGTFRGPYLATEPNDPISGSAFTYTSTGALSGTVKPSAGGSDSTGTPFADY